MKRGAAVAQYRRPERKEVPLNLRITKSQEQELQDALAEEQREPANREMTRTELAQLIWEDGLDLYAARHMVGAERVRALATSTFAGSERATLAEALRRGLDALEREGSGKSKK